MTKFVAACALSLMVPAVAGAQTAAASTGPPRAPRVEFGAAAYGLGAMTLATADANLTRPDGTPLTLFQTANRLTAAKGAELTASVRLFGPFAAEASGSWTRLSLQSVIADDFEGAAPVTAATPVARVTVEGSAVVTLVSRGPLSIFARAGGGWLRDLTSDNRYHQDGSIANVGGGMKYWWRRQPSGFFKRVGFRVEGRVARRSNGLTVGPSRADVAPVLTVGALIGF